MFQKKKATPASKPTPAKKPEVKVQPHDFILVDPITYDKVVALVGDDRNNDAINRLLSGASRSKENPVPHKNAQGIFWYGDLIMKVDTP